MKDKARLANQLVGASIKEIEKESELTMKTNQTMKQSNREIGNWKLTNREQNRM